MGPILAVVQMLARIPCLGGHQLFSQNFPIPRRCGMYQKPLLQRFGSLRELTLAGWEGADDGVFRQIDGNLGCTFVGTNCS